MRAPVAFTALLLALQSPWREIRVFSRTSKTLLIHRGDDIRPLQLLLMMTRFSKHSIPISRNESSMTRRVAIVGLFCVVAAVLLVFSDNNINNPFVNESSTALLKGRPAVLTLVLQWHDGTKRNMRVKMRPDLSPSSVEYLYNMVNQCGMRATATTCKFYRAETYNLQGIIASPKTADDQHRIVDEQNIEMGTCPDEAVYANWTSTHPCPAYDTTCGCHGPWMTRGMFGWAGGKTGPDFFIDLPARISGTPWHTVFGELADEAAFEVVRELQARPVHEAGGMHMLDEPVPFQVTLDGVEV